MTWLCWLSDCKCSLWKARYSLMCQSLLGNSNSRTGQYAMTVRDCEAIACQSRGACVAISSSTKRRVSVCNPRCRQRKTFWGWGMEGCKDERTLNLSDLVLMGLTLRECQCNTTQHAWDVLHGVRTSSLVNSEDRCARLQVGSQPRL